MIRVALVAGTESTDRLAAIVEADGDITVAGRYSADAASAAAVAALAPDVIVAGAEPGTVGFIEAVMASSPKPIIVLGDTDDRAATDAGAVEVVPRPADAASGEAVRRRVRLVRKVVVVRRGRAAAASRQRGRAMVGVAASTGGPTALATVVRGLAGLDAPILVVQHMHRDFVDGLVLWLSRTTGADVVLAAEGVAPKAGVVYVGPADRHLCVGRTGRLTLPTAPDTVHRPSADELFSSMATSLGASAVGVLLTGMGQDGAEGLLAIRQAGGTTMAQDEATSTIFGMPRAARDLGAAGIVASLEDIASAVRKAVARCA